MIARRMEDSGIGILPCSYCVRTKKECSLNPHWARLRLPEHGDRAPCLVPGEGSGAFGDEEQSHDLKRQRGSRQNPPNPQELPTPLTMAGGGGGEANALIHLFQNNPQAAHEAFGWDTPSFAMPEETIPTTATTATSDSTGSSNFNDGVSPSYHQHPSVNPPPPPPLGSWDDLLGSTAYSQPQARGRIPNMELDCFATVPTMAEYPPNHSSNFDGARSSSFDLAQIFSAAAAAAPQHGRGSASYSSMDSPPRHSKKPRRDDADPTRRIARRKRDESRSWQDNYDNTSGMSLSPFAVSYHAMATSNRSIISESLLRIYHDVLENNLACWLAEDTCPYRMSDRRRELVRAHQYTAATATEGPLASWSNRMYRRVKKLDRVAQSTGLVRLSGAENQAASKALDLVVVAFATQWAQGKRRRERRDTEPCLGHDDGGAESVYGDDDDDENFERTLQRSVWEQARQALQDVSDLESFRVIYAELVFGLVQKPWDVDDYGLDQGGPASGGGTAEEMEEALQAAIRARVTDILSQAGPPVFMERAARKIHSLKYRFEAQEAGSRGAERLRRSSSSSNSSSNDGCRRLGTEERRTIGLLYWLAVMFDTVSSSMHERPVVVADEECEHDAAQDLPRVEPKTPILSRRWELEFYAQEDPERPSPLHWPCPLEDALRALSRAASVKVLLFRYVSYLQNAIRKRESGEAIEEIIGITTRVYRYWNRTHGALFRDLTREYDAIPAHIKSRFPCIGIPWHLGSLMLADLIEFVDEHDLGLEKASAERRGTSMAVRIRKSSATELADLAMVAAPPQADTTTTTTAGGEQQQLGDYHFAVSESALLTEPWTVLLIRAFTKAAVFHLGEVEELRRHEWSILGHELSQELQMSVRRARSCIRALGLLGTKAEMARAVARLLTRQIRLYDRRGGW